MLHRLAVFAVILAAPLGASAAQSELAERLEEGKQAYLDGRFRESLQILEEISPNLEDDFLRADCFAFLGMNRFELGDSQAAAQDFESAIRANVDLVPSNDLFPPAALEAFMAKRSTMVGRIEVQTAPAGADATIGNRVVGTTPYVGNALVGQHVVKVAREDYHRYESNVTVEADETTLVEVTMRMTPAALERAREEAARASGDGPRGTKKMAYIILGGAAAGGVAAAVLASGSSREAGAPVTRMFSNTVAPFVPAGPFIADVGTSGTLTIDLMWENPEANMVGEVRLITAVFTTIHEQGPTGDRQMRFSIPVEGGTIYHFLFANLAPNSSPFTLTMTFPG